MDFYTPGLRGRIRPEWTVWCACCAQWEHLARGARNAIALGWCYTKEWGWLCPECIAEYRKQKQKGE